MDAQLSSVVGNGGLRVRPLICFKNKCNLMRSCYIGRNSELSCTEWMIPEHCPYAELHLLEDESGQLLYRPRQWGKTTFLSNRLRTHLEYDTRDIPFFVLCSQYDVFWAGRHTLRLAGMHEDSELMKNVITGHIHGRMSEALVGRGPFIVMTDEITPDQFCKGGIVDDFFMRSRSFFDIGFHSCIPNEKKPSSLLSKPIVKVPLFIRKLSGGPK